MISVRQWHEIVCVACVRLQTNMVMKMDPGEVFVHRNVGNLVNVKDLNCMCCLEYSVDHLKVKHILVCGHYNCGARTTSLSLFIDLFGEDL